MAIDDDIWGKAKAMYEGGATITDIATKTRINRSTINKKSKKDRWVKDANSQLMINEVNNLTDKAALNPYEREFHDKEVKRLTEFRVELQSFSKKAMIKAKELIQDSETGQDFKAIVEGVDKHSVTVGFNQRHANNQINVEANANANNETKKIIIIDAVAEKAKAEQE